MLTISEIKMKLVMSKSKLFYFSKRQKENDCKTILELTFKSRFEADIYTVLREKWANNSWILEPTGVFFGFSYTTIEILKVDILAIGYQKIKEIY